MTVLTMNRTATFGIVGGYGATGRIVTSELWKSCDGEILIGGRDLAKARSLAAECGSRVSAVHLDIVDARSLDDFCSRCSIIVNCAAPTMALQDRVAQAALRGHCHYIDPGGFSLVKERLLPASRKITELGLSFILSAGWIPGISEVLPLYADAQARARMDSVDSVAVYFGDGSEWSTAALRDTVWYLRHFGLRSPGYFSKGEWVRARRSQAYPRVDLGSRIGLGRFYMFSTPELDEIGRRLCHCDFIPHSYLASLRAVVTGALIALVRMPERLSTRLARNLFSSTRLPVGGFVIARATGRSQGQWLALTVQGVYEEHRQYWANGLVPAILARMVSEGNGIRAGVHFTADAVDPIAFLTELRKAGVDLTENFEQLRQ